MREMGRLAWFSLVGHLRDMCEALNSSTSYGDKLRLAPHSTLYFEHPSKEQVNVLYCCGSEDNYWLRVHCDLDLVFLRYDACGVGSEYLGAREGDKVGFKVHDGWILQTAQELAESMLFFLTVFKS